MLVLEICINVEEKIKKSLSTFYSHIGGTPPTEDIKTAFE